MYRIGLLITLLLSVLSIKAQSVIAPIVPNTPTNTSKIYKYTPSDGGIFYTMTRGNEWAIVNIGRADGDKNHGCKSQLFNMNTGEMFPVMVQGHAIPFEMASNDGNIVVGHYGDVACSVNRATGKMTVYPNRPLWHGGQLVDCTPDGKYAVGYYEGYLGASDNSDIPNDWFYRTLLVDTETGDTIATPGIPQTKRNGQKYQSIKFTSISNDGRYISGAIDWYLDGAMYFTYDRILDKVVNESLLSIYCGDIASRYDDVVSVSGSRMSPSGNVFGCNVTLRQPDGSTKTCLGVYYRDREELVTYPDAEDGGVSICALDDNGTYYGINETGSPLRDFKILYDGKYWVSLNQLCHQRYGYDFFEATGFERSGTIMGVSPDGHKLISFHDPMGESFCFDFGMSSKEACSTLDFLSQYTATPENGSQFEQLKSVEITFERPVRIIGNGSYIHLYDSNGQQVAAGLSTEYALQHKGDAKNTVIASIRNKTLNPNEEYTFVIDANAFATEKSDDCFSKEIRLQYIGREGPVQLVKSTPEAGSAIMKMDNSSSYVILTFDSKVQLTENCHARLEHEDGSFAASLTMVAGYLEETKNQILLYPPTTVNMYDGQKYRIVIDAGSISDYSGSEKSFNERIEVEYTGMYVRPIPTGHVLFQDSWDDIAESLLTWLRYDGDHLTPQYTPASWGFDNDNQPWNFSIRESNDNPDYCAASHSMYAPSGKSDDWMMTPQINMPAEGKTVLEFDAQCYYMDGNDVLDVYVYEDSRVISYLNDNNMAAIRPNCVKVLSETLSAGATVEGLSNEWTHYTVDLSAWNGKDIYVAFVNQNNNKSAIFIDNVLVQREMLYSLALDYEESVVAATEQKVSGRLGIVTDKPVTSISLVLRDGQGTEIDRIDWQNISGNAQGRQLPFAFGKMLPLTVGKVTKYSIDIIINDRSDSYMGTITNLAFKPVKRVVLEEMTGIDCPNCPLGIVMIEKLRMMYGDRFIPVSLHTYTGDPYAAGMMDYSNSLELIAAPSARINRTKGIYYPIRSTSTEFVDQDANNPLWLDVVAREMDRAPLCDMTIKAEYTDDSKHDVRYTADVTYAVDADNQHLSLLFVILEDGIVNYQQNGFSGIESPVLKEWGKGGKYSDGYVYPYLHNDVARSFVGNNFTGTIGILPTTYFANETVNASVTAQFPSHVVADNAHVVGMLIDTQTGEVKNAAECRYTTIAEDPDGINEVITETDSAIFNLQGQRIISPRAYNIYIKGGKKKCGR